MLSALLIMLLAMVLALKYNNSGQASAQPVPVGSKIYTDGSGTVRMDLYYRTEDVPDKNGVPSRDMDGNGLRWRFDAVTGPVDTDMGECWAVSYTRLEYE